jgi:hypothetical protein
VNLKTPPFEMYESFPGRLWIDILPETGDGLRDLVAELVKFGGSRETAEQALERLGLMSDTGESREVEPAEDE